MPEVFKSDIDDDRAINELCSIIERNDLILFAGAGLSAQAVTQDKQHPPLWRELMIRMIDWCEAERLIDSLYAKEIRELVEVDLLDGRAAAPLPATAAAAVIAAGHGVDCASLFWPFHRSGPGLTWSCLRRPARSLGASLAWLPTRQPHLGVRHADRPR
jgi:hypothetical protein